jgi:trans-aconitate 2-methyltransferase
MYTSTIQVVTDAWNPTTYRTFAQERAQPFVDLLALIDPTGVDDAVDLGCGPGELTRRAADELGCRTMVGIDNSPAMLAKTDEHAGGSVRFEHGDIGTWTASGEFDLILASASLHWIPDHARVLARWRDALRPAGQLAVQVPANAYMPSHTVADRLAHSEPFLSAFGAGGPPSDPVADNVLEPEQYATLLHDLGFVEQHVRLQVYPHLLASSRSVVDWVRGSTLTRFESRLEPAMYDEFVAAYERALIDVIGEHSPHFFPFRRILMWGRLPD